MKRVSHIDFGVVNLDGSKVVRTKQGYLRVPATVTRTGVLTYRLPDGTVERRLRHPDDVFDPTSMATLAGIPATEDHPAYRGGPILLDAHTTKDWQIGFTGDQVERVGERYVGVPVTITDAASLVGIDSGELYEVSCGYTSDRDETPGVYEGEPYDVRQRNIVYNHLAIVRGGKARAGRDMRLNLDSEAAIEVDSANPYTGEVMKIKIGGKEFDATDVAGIQAHLDSIEANHRAAGADWKAEKDRMQASLDGLQADLTKANDKAKAALDSNSPERIQSFVKERKRIEKVAERTLADDALKNLDSMSDADVKAAVIKAERPNVNLDGKSDGYIDASFDAIEERLGEDDPTAKVGKKIAEARKEGTQLDSTSAKQKQDEEFSKSWQREDK